MSNWEETKFILASNPNARLRLDVEREGAIIAKELVPEERDACICYGSYAKECNMK